LTITDGKRIGVFGGAFDPPHMAHFTLARVAMEQLGLDHLHVLPTGYAWHKSRSLTSAEHRLELCRLAFAELDGTNVDSREIRRSGPTYTIDTLLELQSEYPGAQLFLLMGGDQAKALKSWHRYEEICHIAIICVAARPEAPGSPEPQSPDLPAFARVQTLRMPPSELSATNVRNRASVRKSVDTLVSASVARYIEQHHLYQNA